MSLLHLRNLSVWLTGPDGAAHHVVRGATLGVAPGERVGLIGNSGSGKTTTVLAAMGLLPPSARIAGEVLFRGRDILRGGERTMRPHRWRDIALIPQGAMNALNPVRRIAEQIVEPMRFHGVAEGPAARRRVDELLELVSLPPSCATRYPHELSGGMRQRAVIAMALCCDPAVLLADEPTTALDVIVQSQILELLRRAATERGLALVLVTHDLAVVAQLCERVAVMHDGAIVEQGSVDDVYERPHHPHTRALLDAARLSGRPVRAPAVSGDGGMPDVALEVDGLRAEYRRPRSIAALLRRRRAPRVRAVDGISMRIRAGETLALVGESGCGKTTTAMAMLRLHEPSAGAVQVAGSDVRALSPAQLRAWRVRAQLIFQDPYEALEPRMTVMHAIEEPLRIHYRGQSRAVRRARATAALEAAGLVPTGAFAARRPHELSGGERQRAAIAASTVLDPAVLIADEPVSMVDASMRAAVLSLLATMCRERRMALLLITHDLLSAAWIGDRTAVMYLGRIVETGPATALLERPLHPYTQALVAAVPRMDRAARTLTSQLPGEPSSAIAESGCRFRNRCPLATNECAEVDPPLRPISDDAGAEHLVACINV